MISTPEGLIFIVVGHVVGTVVSLLLLLIDGDVLPPSAGRGPRRYHGYDHQRVGLLRLARSDYRLGSCRHHASDCLHGAGIPRPDRRPAGARPCDLASLQEMRGAVGGTCTSSSTLAEVCRDGPILALSGKTTLVSARHFAVAAQLTLWLAEC